MGLKEPMHRRSKYVDHSLKFANWVNRLGIERTFLGRAMSYLERRFHLRRLILLFFFCLGLSLLLNFDLGWVSRSYQVGDIASTDIYSPVSFEMVDEITTAKKRGDAMGAIPPIYDYDVSRFELISTRTNRAFREMRLILGDKAWPKNPDRKSELIRLFIRNKEHFEQELGVASIPDSTFEWLTENKFSVKVESLILRLLSKSISQKVVVDLTQLKDANINKVILRPVTKRGAGKEELVPVSQLMDLTQFRNQISTSGLKGTMNLSLFDEDVLIKMAQILSEPNTALNKSETSNRRLKAREDVLPVKISIQKTQPILAKGSLVQPSHMAILEKIKAIQSGDRQGLKRLMMALLFMTLIVVFVSYLKRFVVHKVQIERRDYLAMGIVTLIVIAISKLFLFMTSSAFSQKLGFVIPETVFLYATPVASGSMLIGLVLARGEVVWLYSLFIAIVTAASTNFDFGYLVLGLVGGVAGARGVFACKKRNDIYWAGLRVSLLNTAVIVFIIIVKSQDNPNLLSEILWHIPSGIMSGLISSFVAMTFVPMLESLFNYTTDVKLLELSNLNHPLLKEMIVKAPGTYHHSLIVGSMCEAAAEEIGGNPLLAKVGSYYHDIGKMVHSQYFIENQKTGNNPHDHISPAMSKTVLVAHAKDGVELGEKYKLGKQIIDMIIQHHGTTLISYFYNKAKTMGGEAFEDIGEEEFRYPGPKPQSKEAALCMLADSIEAAARSLDEPTPARLQNIVKNIIHRKFMDGQMDECNLTLRDLKTIEDSFTRTLLTIYHQRIDYPKAAGGGASEAPERR